VPDIAFGGGFSSEDGVFKALALGAPFTKAVCMGRALMIPGMVGKNIAQWIKDGKLPNTVSQFGTTPEEIFVCYEEVKDMVGPDEMKSLPLGALGVYSYAEKIRVGLQQIMAGARCFSIPVISRNDLMSLTEECANVTGIPYLMNAYREEALNILDGHHNGQDALGSSFGYRGAFPRLRSYGTGNLAGHLRVPCQAF
jgi:hypothetical protein